MSCPVRRLTCKHIDTAEMKNACYCTLLAAAVLVSCQQAPKNTETAAGSGGGTASATAGQSSAQEIPANTVLWVRLRKDIDSSRFKAGDHFSAEVSSPIVLNGKAVVPQGTPVDGVVVQSQTAAQPGTTGQLALQVKSFRLGLRSFQVQTDTVNLQSPPVKTNESDRLAKREGAAFVPKNENLQFTITSPVNLK